MLVKYRADRARGVPWQQCKGLGVDLLAELWVTRSEQALSLGHYKLERPIAISRMLYQCLGT